MTNQHLKHSGMNIIEHSSILLCFLILLLVFIHKRDNLVNLILGQFLVSKREISQGKENRLMKIIIDDFGESLSGHAHAQ